MLLRNVERYLEVLQVGVDQKSCRRILFDDERGMATHRFFFDHDSATFGLGVSRGAVCLLLASRVVPYGPGISTRIQQDGESRIFTASQDGVTLANVTYLPGKPFRNLFPMDDEDVDGFLWIHNVLSSAERRAVFIKHNTD